MLVVLALSTFMLIAPFGSMDALAFWNSAKSLFIGTFVTAMFFLPAVRLACTQRESWSAHRRAQRGLHDFGPLVRLLCLAMMIAIVLNEESLSTALTNAAFDVAFSGLIVGGTPVL
ncbi:hypothetical protein E9536_40320 [Burkholderia sp. LS-044]|uniref:hypothetical protein n=1 Tax=Burkholderia sp. LS-044 TaxID=1459967 RepID=UPI0010A66056|nr:hypothetical protein [Burkholderia sp. LS-044]THJ45997.1 hypothetical protein E9536_40320 [Burkholderia sp. LS-044]